MHYKLRIVFSSCFIFSRFAADALLSRWCLRASLSFLLINFSCFRAFEILWNISDGFLHWMLIGSSSASWICLIWECCDMWVVSWVCINVHIVNFFIAMWSSGDHNELCWYWDLFQRRALFWWCMHRCYLVPSPQFYWVFVFELLLSTYWFYLVSHAL